MRNLTSLIAIFIQKYFSPGKGLFMNKFSKFKKEFITSNIIQPIYNHKIIASPAICPERPVIKRSFRQVFQLVTEIFCHKLNYPLISSGTIILLQHFQHDHFWPPVLAAGFLKPGFRFRFHLKLNRAKIPVLSLVLKAPFNPLHGLGLEFRIIQDIRQWD